MFHSMTYNNKHNEQRMTRQVPWSLQGSLILELKRRVTFCREGPVFREDCREEPPFTEDELVVVVVKEVTLDIDYYLVESLLDRSGERSDSFRLEQCRKQKSPLFLFLTLCVLSIETGYI